jgi:zinc protease
MQKNPSLFVQLLLAVAITAQLSCARPTAAPQPEPTSSPSPTEQAQIEQILQRYEQALGGKEALDALTSYRLKASFTFPGMAGTIESWRKEPLKTLSVTTFPRIGVLKKGFDGETRWVQTPAGTFSSESGPQEIAELEREADAYSAGKIRAFFDSLKLQPKAWLSGRDVYVIEGKPAKGPAEKLYFDIENGLLLRWDMARRRADRGTVWVKIHFDDYRDVAGVKLPHKMRFAFEQFSFNVQVNEVEHNIPIDDAIFKKPN